MWRRAHTLPRNAIGKEGVEYAHQEPAQLNCVTLAKAVVTTSFSRWREGKQAGMRAPGDIHRHYVAKSSMYANHVLRLVKTQAYNLVCEMLSWGWLSLPDCDAQGVCSLRHFQRRKSMHMDVWRACFGCF